LASATRHLFATANLLHSRRLLDMARWVAAAHQDIAALRDELGAQADGGES
jgi:hypothetical protein